MPIQSPAQEPVAAELTKLAGCSIHDLRDALARAVSR